MKPNKQIKITLSQYSNLNQEIINELDELFSVAPPDVLSKDLVPIFEKQLRLTFAEMNKTYVSERKVLKQKLTATESKLENLVDAFVDRRIGQKQYEARLVKFEEEIAMFEAEIEKREIGVSNLEEYIEVSLLVAENPSVLWEYSDYDERQLVQKTFFPENIIYDRRKHNYRTSKVNEFLRVTSSFSPFKEDKKKERTSNKTDSSGLVAGAGLEPTTFGL